MDINSNEPGNRRDGPVDGARLTGELVSRVASIAVGEVDRVLEGLLGPQLATLV